MVVVRKAAPLEIVAKPVKKTARCISFFDYVREDYGLNPTNPDMTGMNEKAMNRAMREHRELIEEIRIEYYLEVADGKIEEPDEAVYVDKAAIVTRLRDSLPKEWTHNVGKAKRDLVLGMELRIGGGNGIWVVDHVSPAGATVQLVSGSPDPHFTTARRIIISRRSEVWYRRQTPATIRSMADSENRNKSRLTE